MTDASHAVVVFCEGSTDQNTIRVLATRVLVDLAGGWLEPRMLEFRGIEANSGFCAWHGLRDLPSKAPRRFAFGFRDGEGDQGPDSLSAWKALWAALELRGEGPLGAVLLRDGDNSRAEPERAARRMRHIQAGVRAFSRLNEAFPVAVGVPEPKVEAWILNTLDPSASAVTEVRTQRGLSFNPVTSAHELLGGPGSKTDAKAVLADLVGDTSRWSDRLDRLSLSQLAERGAQTGLAAFLRGLRCDLGTMVAAHIPPCDRCTCGPASPQ